MKSKPVLAAAVLLAAMTAALLASAGSLKAADLFYTDLLRDGAHAYERGDHAGASQILRLACFGLLDEPGALAECLARLALAQDKTGDQQGFRDTFGRLVEIEERFQAYSRATLPAGVREALEPRLAALIPAATLAGSPAPFRALAGRKAGATPREQPRPQTTQAPPAAAPAQSPAQPPAQSNTRPEAATGTTGAPGTPGTKGASPKLQTDPPPATPAKTAASPRPLTEEEQRKLETVRRLLAETGKARELRQAFQLAREVADAHPESVEAQHLAGEAAYRVSRWQDAASYLQRGGGPQDDEPERLFYLAVALYESGNARAAADVLRRSLPNLQRSSYVDSYARKILGSDPSSALSGKPAASSRTSGGSAGPEQATGSAQRLRHVPDNAHTKERRRARPGSAADLL